MPSWQAIRRLHNARRTTANFPICVLQAAIEAQSLWVVQDHADSFSERSLLTCKDTATVNYTWSNPLHIVRPPIAKYKFALVSLVTVAHLTHLLLQRNRPTIAVPTAFVTVALSPTCHHKLNPNFALTGKKDGPSDSCTNRGPQSN